MINEKSNQLKNEKYNEKEILQISVLIAFASILQISETIIPYPLPGLRLGLANLIILLVLYFYGFKRALLVNVLRTIVSSIIIGTFLSPTFILSFLSAIVSICVMNFAYRFSLKTPIFRLSLIGISITGAIAHNITQLLVAYFLLIKNIGIFHLLPYLLLSAVIMGSINGLIVLNVIRKIQISKDSKEDLSFNKSKEELKEQYYFNENSVLFHVKAIYKIIVLVMLIIALIAIESLCFYAGVCALLSILFVFSKTPVKHLLKRVLKLLGLIIISFLIPLIFVNEGRVLLDGGIIQITDKAILKGTLYGTRIFLLIFASSLFFFTTSINDMKHALSIIFRPLSLINNNAPEFLSELISTTLHIIPKFLNKVHHDLKIINKDKEKRLKRNLKYISDVLESLF